MKCTQNTNTRQQKKKNKEKTINGEQHNQHNIKRKKNKQKSNKLGKKISFLRERKRIAHWTVLTCITREILQ